MSMISDAWTSVGKVFVLAVLLDIAYQVIVARTRLVKRNIKRWRGGQMDAALGRHRHLDAVKGFRRLKGYADMPTLVSALRARDRQFGFVTAEENRQVA